MAALATKKELSKKRESLLLRIAPVPRFLEMSASGVDISDTHVRMIQLERGKVGYKVRKFAEETLPSGLIENGDIRDPQGLLKKITEFGKKNNLYFVRVALSEEKAYLFKTTIPRVPKKEIPGAVKFRLEENVPIGVAEAVFDYTLMPETDKHADHFDLEVAVLPKKVVESYVDIFKKAGMHPLSFMIEAQAVMRSLIEEGDTSTSLIVNIGPEKTGLYITSGGVVHFTSTVAIGGGQFTKLLESHLNISAAEAEELKIKEGLDRHHGNDELFFTLMNSVAALKDEIKKIALYWENREEKGEETSTLRRIILAGKDAVISGLDTYLAQTLKKEVIVGNVWTNVMSLSKEIPVIPHQESLNYAGAIGAALFRR